MKKDDPRGPTDLERAGTERDWGVEERLAFHRALLKKQRRREAMTDGQWLFRMLARIVYMPVSFILLTLEVAWMYGAQFKPGSGWWIAGAFSVVVAGLIIELAFSGKG
ncbi:hypothetical protein NDR87_18745 [Nocardia sp. CDC159]|uniref:Uncharacterized protein n=1 Tax=Nocardia pulmonis TaxID=2951408 RepID=A0A9X2E9P5_9NOCA|nr:MULTISPECIES: hypothetical protein [Nocardia]MCM6776271.1 hypothetical protein [Nocardia pulmonis]MCM6788403.1 hypothetical protein [Nocardia sp. CDC159]